MNQRKDMVKLHKMQILTFNPKWPPIYVNLIIEHTNFTPNNLILITYVSLVLKLPKIAGNMVLKG